MGNPFDPSENICHVGSKNTSISVDLVNDNIVQICEELSPASVVGKDPQVEHIRICDDDASRISYCGSIMGFSISIINPHRYRKLLDWYQLLIIVGSPTISFFKISSET